MFRGLIFDSAMFLWAGIPILTALGLFLFGLKIWWEKVKGGATFKFSGDVFRDPTNAALTVSGLFIPLLCGAIGYLIEKSAPPHDLIPLLAATILFGLSVLVGLWNLFSMTSFKDGNDVIEIKKDGVWGFVAQFATQLFIMFGGIVVLLVYFLFFFDLKPQSAAPPSIPNAIMIARAPLRAGMSVSDVVQAWGAPEHTTNTGPEIHWTYEGGESEFEIVIRNERVWSIQERIRE